jgi:ubiquinone/menaquinone biosynthesis C-methylase UbiE
LSLELVLARKLPANHHTHKRIPNRLTSVLNNPIRRRLSPPERLISKLDISPRDVVVDFGCGPGFFLIPLAGVATKAIGIDVSTPMLERAASYAKKNKVTVELLQSNGTDVRLQDNSVNLILLGHVFHEVEDEQRVLKEFLRVLKPSGRLVIVERTRPNRMLPATFSPPTVNEMEVVEQIQRAGFAFSQTIPYGKDSIIIARK